MDHAQHERQLKSLAQRADQLEREWKMAVMARDAAVLAALSDGVSQRAVAAMIGRTKGAMPDLIARAKAGERA